MEENDSIDDVKNYVIFTLMKKCKSTDRWVRAQVAGGGQSRGRLHRSGQLCFIAGGSTKDYNAEDDSQGRPRGRGGADRNTAGGGAGAGRVPALIIRAA